MIHAKNIILCADDFGLSESVSRGILKLVRQQRLSAVSCMVNGSDFSHSAQDLYALHNQVQIGLHFNLTEGFLLSEPATPCFSLNKLLIKSHLRLLDSSLISREFNAQLDLYSSTMNGLPDFIDGHQHIHQFPQISEVILKVYQQRLEATGSYIRSTYPAISSAEFKFKKNILALTGGKKLYSKLKKLNIPHNQYFSGIYNFAQDSNYRALFRQWLQDLPSDTLIMCHPGEKELNSSDAIAHTRPVELDYFLSTEFIQDCQEFTVHLTTGPKSREDKTVNCY